MMHKIYFQSSERYESSIVIILPVEGQLSAFEMLVCRRAWERGPGPLVSPGSAIPLQECLMAGTQCNGYLAPPRALTLRPGKYPQLYPPNQHPGFEPNLPRR
jgi:hypothetical protein